MENAEYTYNGEIWTQALTVPDENSFFHSAFGTNADEVYYDKHAKVKRLQWAAFLTYFQNETKPALLVETLKKCLLAHEEYKNLTLEDNDQFEKYISGVTATETPVTLEEIPILTTLYNVKVTVLLDQKGDSAVVVEPNQELLGEYKSYVGKLTEVFMCLEDQTFSRLEPVVKRPPPPFQKEAEDIGNLLRMLQFPKEGSVPQHVAVIKLIELLISSSQSVFLDKKNPYGIPEQNEKLLEQFDKCLIYIQTLALKYLFEPNQYNLFLSYQEEVDESVQQDVLTLGVVEKVGNKHCFTNKAFAEYFLGKCCVKELELRNDKVEFQRFFFEEILSKPDYTMTRAFFNMFLENGLDSIPSDIFRNYSTYRGEGEPLHTSRLFYSLCTEGCLNVIRLLFKCLEFRTITDKEVRINDVPQNLRGNTLAVLQYLLQHGGVNMKDTGGLSPIFATVNAGHVDIVKFLVEHGANVNISDDRGVTPLHGAFKNLPLVKTLIELGANINAVDSNLSTPLHLAAENGSPDIIRYLVERGAHINALNHEGFTPLHCAAIRGRWEIARLLVELGALFKTPGSHGDMLVNLYASRGQLDLVRYLASLGADLNVLDDLGDSSLSLAIVSNRVDTVKCLVELGADVNGKARGGLPLIVIAGVYGYSEITKILVEHGADIEAKDRGGCAALHIAASKGELELVKYLAEKGADLNVKTNEGDTSLHWAAVKGHGEVARFLVESRAEANVRNCAGRTPLAAAESEGKSDVAAVLKELGCV